MSNMTIQFMTALALGRNKDLTNQESMRAAVMAYIGSTMPRNASAILGTMSAVNEEVLKNKLETSEAARVLAESKIDLKAVDLQTKLTDCESKLKAAETAKGTAETQNNQWQADWDTVFKSANATSKVGNKVTIDADKDPAVLNVLKNRTVLP